MPNVIEYIYKILCILRTTRSNVNNIIINNITLEYAYEVGRVAASAARPAKKEKKADPGASPSRP